MKIEKFVLGSMGTNCYIAVNEENGECILVDLAAWPPELSSHIRTGGLKPLAVLLTHGHFDHIMGLDGCSENMTFLSMPLRVRKRF